MKISTKANVLERKNNKGKNETEIRKEERNKSKK